MQRAGDDEAGGDGAAVSLGDGGVANFQLNAVFKRAHVAGGRGIAIAVYGTSDAPLIAGGTAAVIACVQGGAAAAEGVIKRAAAVKRQRRQLWIAAEVACAAAADGAAAAALDEVVAAGHDRSGTVWPGRGAVARDDAVDDVKRAAISVEAAAVGNGRIFINGHVSQGGAALVVQAAAAVGEVVAEGDVGERERAGVQNGPAVFGAGNAVAVDDAAAYHVLAVGSGGDGPATKRTVIVGERAVGNGDGADIVVDGAAPVAGTVAGDAAAVHGEATLPHFHRAAEVYGRIVANFPAILHRLPLKDVQRAAAKNSCYGAIAGDGAIVQGE